jgi:hypothetical protein
LAILPLRLGPLAAGTWKLRRSGIRWLRQDGDVCRAGEIIAYCNLGLFTAQGAKTIEAFGDESRDLQVAFAARAAGRLTLAAGKSRGGYQDLLNVLGWSEDTVIGTLETSDPQAPDDPAGGLSLIMFAGRRFTGLAEVRSGPMTGWHNRSRAWRVSDHEPVGTLLSLGVCELLGVIRGDGFVFQEVFDAAGGAVQFVFVPDEPLAPSAALVVEQMLRSPAQHEEIARDLMEAISNGDQVPEPADWMFAGAVLQALQSSPVQETWPVMTRSGVSQAGPADAVLMSLHAESPFVLRHRRLGYTFHCHQYRLRDAGPAFRAFLRSNFEPVTRTIPDIARDYRQLIALLRQSHPRTQLLVCNMMSTSGVDDLQSYAGFEEPISLENPYVWKRELNLMLHDLVAEHDIAIVDSDAIGAALGGVIAIHDGIHQNGEMQAMLRSEIVGILGARGVAGFGPAVPVS